MKNNTKSSLILQRKIILISAVILSVSPAFGQFTPDGVTGRLYHLDGNVGIGNDNPINAKLEVVQTSNKEGLRIDGASGAFALVVEAGTTNVTHVRSGLTIGSGSSYFTTPPSNGLIIQGNVGIGVTNPSSKLFVSGNITTTAKMLFRKTDGSGTAGFGMSGNAENIHLEGTALLPHMNGVQDLGSSTYRFNNIYSAGIGRFEGKVVIGTTSNPGSYHLIVEGLIGAKSIRVTTAGWADYVFSPTYSLLSLYETEEFIQKNGHLPNVPSSEEIEKDGFALEEMDAKLMEKVEELTLYMIEQQKQLDRQTEEIAKLREQLNPEK